MVQVLFVHPDLGIGGAERLVIDAALALKKKGHNASFITAHHDSSHCFPETADGSVDVLCVGDWLPRSTCGFMYAFWAYIRMIYVAIYLTFFSNIDYEVLFVDQVSACIPILRLNRKAKIIFYCHYPDQLLTKRNNILKKIYRFFIDKIEEFTTKMADVILVNSKFTAGVFKSTFKSISINPSVLYPSINFDSFEHQKSAQDSATDQVMFLSLNRYERKKCVELAIKAFHLLLEWASDADKSRLSLIVAGGYDNRVKENIEYYSELVALTKHLGIEEYVTFMKSPSDVAKVSLLSKASCLLYTPSNEHFGIVPIEAMYMGTPVIAVDNGGPVETILDNATGFLRKGNPEAFSAAMKKFIDGTTSKSNMTKACKSHVINKFSPDNFSNYLHYVVQGLVDGRKQR